MDRWNAWDGKTALMNRQRQGQEMGREGPVGAWTDEWAYRAAKRVSRWTEGQTEEVHGCTWMKRHR